MKRFITKEYVETKNPDPGKFYRTQLLSAEDRAKLLGGIFAIVVPGSDVPYHYHRVRESLIIVISGKGIEIVEGKEIPIKAGDILYIPANEKHCLLNRADADEDLRYVEFFTQTTEGGDFIEVEK